MLHPNILVSVVASEETQDGLSVWNTYSEKRFNKTCQVSRGKFQFILSRIRYVPQNAD